MQRVRLKDVAARAGVSAMTVSAALSGKGRISPATVAEIRKIAADMGYQTNAAAQILKQKKGGNIGLLILEDAVNIRPNSLLAGMIIHFTDLCRQAGIRPHVEWFDYNAYPKSIPDTFYSGLVDGLIIYGYGNSSINAVLNRGIPVPFVRLMEPGKHCVCRDIVGEIADVMSYLHAAGHRRVFFLNGLVETDYHLFTAAKAAYYAQGQAIGGNEMQLHYHEQDDRTPADWAQLTRRILSSRASAVIMHNPTLVKTCMCGLLCQGVKVPQEVGFVCLGTQDFDCDFTIPLTATEIDIREMMNCATNLVRELLKDANIARANINVHSPLKVRASTSVCGKSADTNCKLQ